MRQGIIILFLVLLLSVPVTSAQDTSIEINGVVEAISDNTITVNGLPITISDVDTGLTSQLVTGATIRITGNLQNGTVIAITIEIISLPEPSTSTIDIEKFVSIDGGATWQDADAAPGPAVELNIQVAFRLVVTNSGTGELTGISLADDVFDTSGCVIPGTLAAGAFFECNLGPFPAASGQHSNTATVTAMAGSASISDMDMAHYFGGNRPSITLEKFVSDNGSTWADADNAPGPEFELDADDDVSFRFVIFNDGNVPLTNLALSDDSFNTGSCLLPTALAPEEIVECVIGPFPAEAGQHTNVATVTAIADTITVTATDSANYFGGEIDDDDDDGDSGLPITIVVEGPVETINVNIITIFDIDIEVNINDPILNIIQIGDVVRVEGNLVDDSDTIIIIAINIIIIDIDIFINDDGTEVWRDDGNCSNGPPPWAPAHGWRRKCEGGGNNNGNNGRGNGNGRNRGDDDDDDD